MILTSTQLVIFGSIYFTLIFESDKTKRHFMLTLMLFSVGGLQILDGGLNVIASHSVNIMLGQFWILVKFTWALLPKVNSQRPFQKRQF